MERAVFLLARHLQARGVETVLVTRPATRAGAFPGEVVTVPYGGGTGRHGGVLDRTLRYPRFSRRVGEAVAGLRARGARGRRGRPGPHRPGLRPAPRRRIPALRAPLVMNPQGMEEHHATRPEAPGPRAACGRSRARPPRLADRVVATDEATRDEVPRLLGVAAGAGGRAAQRHRPRGDRRR